MCGVVGISTTADEAARLGYFGLFALQHRGQEAAGIAASDGRVVRQHKAEGLVSQVFEAGQLDALVGSQAIGHTRYSTTGAPGHRNTQPFLIETMFGPLALAHNGNIVNAAELRTDLLARGMGLQSSSDSEVMTLMLASMAGTNWEERLAQAMHHWMGAFSITLLTSHQVLACRDRWGFHPLHVGELPDRGHAIASETGALRTLGCTRMTEVAPGEIVVLEGDDIRHIPAIDPAARGARCSFEHIYFTRPDADWDDRNVHDVRQRLGRILARESPVAADVVIPVPDSSTPAAIGYAAEAGITYTEGFVKNRYIGRTFIEPTAHLRKQGVALKFTTLPSNLAGKRVVMVDDSIVRGTTSLQLVQMVRDAGASEVHVRVTCPPITHPCHFGVDMGTYEELIAHHRTVPEINDYIGADSLAFLSLEGMRTAIGDPSQHCDACFTGDYPVPVQLSLDGLKGQFEGMLQ